jgi:hypothetical protein
MGWTTKSSEDERNVVSANRPGTILEVLAHRAKAARARREATGDVCGNLREVYI